MRPEEGAILDSFQESLAGIDALVERRLLQPALVVLYATIDAAAWLSVDGAADVNRNTFVRWVDQYFLPGSGLECSALELYGARCGLLHSLTAFSQLSRDGKIRTLGYAWGTASAQDLNETAYWLRRPDLVGVHVDNLRTALRSGLQAFFDDASTDPTRWANVLSRAKSLFSHLPTLAIAGSLTQFRAQQATVTNEGNAAAPQRSDGTSTER